jgi:aarF domain-containing kinase
VSATTSFLRAWFVVTCCCCNWNLAAAYRHGRTNTVYGCSLNHIRAPNSPTRLEVTTAAAVSGTSPVVPGIVAPESALNLAQRISRALNFYATAIPVFGSYTLLDQQLKFEKDILGKNITEEEEKDRYNVIHDWGSDAISDKIKLLKGFYVKTGQIISTRVDIFPPQYTDKLALMQDSLDPIAGDIIKQVVSRELLGGADLSDLFLEFDDVPLGSASIAQVHKAKLLDGRVVAVKVQRPGIEGKLLGDISNLKNFAKAIADFLPIDYYKIFSEIERTLGDELDFLKEAQATLKVAAAVAHSPSNKPRQAAVTVPLPITGLVTKKVMVLEFIDGIALSRIAAEMSTRGVTSGSPESVLLGTKLLTALTDAYSSMIFGSGIIHGDPHPGNIFIMKGGEVALLDCGQVKQISTAERIGLAELVVLVNDWEKEYRKVESSPKEYGNATLTELTSIVANKVRSFGVTFKEGVGDDCAAAVAILLFGSSNTKLPGGYAGEEISLDSPIVQVTQFSDEFILLGRATVMLRGIANRLGIAWGLSDRWAAVAREALAATDPKERLPIWSVVTPQVPSTRPGISSDARLVSGKERIRFQDVLSGLNDWVQLLKVRNVSPDLSRELHAPRLAPHHNVSYFMYLDICAGEDHHVGHQLFAAIDVAEAHKDCFVDSRSVFCQKQVYTYLERHLSPPVHKMSRNFYIYGFLHS